MARVAAITPDLLFGSKVLGLLEAGGHDAVLAPGPHALGGADVAVVDLTQGWVERPAGLPALAVYSHVEAEVRERAESAGYDLVVPRSRFMREGAALVSRLAS
jgi:hypothetical protein